MVFSQLVDAASINGPSQELVHFVLGVHRLLDAAAGSRREDVAAQRSAAANGKKKPSSGSHLLVFTGGLVNPLQTEENRGVMIGWGGLDPAL